MMTFLVNFFLVRSPSLHICIITLPIAAVQSIFFAYSHGLSFLYLFIPHSLVLLVLHAVYTAGLGNGTNFVKLVRELLTSQTFSALKFKFVVGWFFSWFTIFDISMQSKYLSSLLQFMKVPNALALETHIHNMCASIEKIFQLLAGCLKKQTLQKLVAFCVSGDGKKGFLPLDSFSHIFSTRRMRWTKSHNTEFAIKNVFSNEYLRSCKMH